MAKEKVKFNSRKPDFTNDHWQILLFTTDYNLQETIFHLQAYVVSNELIRAKFSP